MPREPQLTYVVPVNLTEEQIAEAHQSPMELARTLGRATAEACHKLRIAFDMGEPQVARDVMMAAYDGMVQSGPPTRTVPMALRETPIQ